VPLQNRVTPFGELIAVEARGTLMGNRGCLHDEQRRIRRRFAGRRWIHCVLEFKGRRRTVMTPHRYTELFFLDEATALAAGHRPCAECQRERYLDFRAHWAAARGAGARSAALSVDAIDRVLHDERLAPGGGQRTHRARVDRLPAGVMVVDAQGQPHLVVEHALRRWTPAGYADPIRRPPATLSVLTPRSMVRAIEHGYVVGLHPSATRGRGA
jgi:hypothetical protein